MHKSQDTNKIYKALEVYETHRIPCIYNTSPQRSYEYQAIAREEQTA